MFIASHRPQWRRGSEALGLSHPTKLWRKSDRDAGRSKWQGMVCFPIPARLSSVHLQPVRAADGRWTKGLAVPYSWQTVFSWSCRVPVSVGEDLALCHSLRWYTGILPSFLPVFPSLDITCVGGGGGEAKGGTWGECEKRMKLSMRYSPRWIPRVRKGVDFWMAAWITHVYYFYAESNWNT